MKMAVIPWGYKQSDRQPFKPFPHHLPQDRASVNIVLYVGIGQQANTTGQQAVMGVKGSSEEVSGKIMYTRADFSETALWTKTKETNVDIAD